MSKFNVGDKVVIHWKLDIKDFVQDGVITAIHAGEYGVIVKTEDSGGYSFNRDGWYTDEKSRYIEKIEPKTQFKVGDKVVGIFGDEEYQGFVVGISECASDYNKVEVKFNHTKTPYGFSSDGFYCPGSDSRIVLVEDFDQCDNDETDAEFLEFLHNELDYGGCSSREYDYLAGYLARANGEQSSIITNFKEKFDKQNSPEYKEYLRLKAIYD